MPAFRMTATPLLPALALVAGAGFVSGWHARDWGGTSPARAALPAATAAIAAPGVYAARVLRIVDGDTLEAQVAIWPGQTIEVKVRLRGIDAPELDGACREEAARADAARDALARLAAGDIVLSEVGPDRYYGRVVARVAAQGVDLGAALIAAGHARHYGGRKRTGWCPAQG